MADYFNWRSPRRGHYCCGSIDIYIRPYEVLSALEIVIPIVSELFCSFPYLVMIFVIKKGFTIFPYK